MQNMLLMENLIIYMFLFRSEYTTEMAMESCLKFFDMYIDEINSSRNSTENCFENGNEMINFHLSYAHAEKQRNCNTDNLSKCKYK